MRLSTSLALATVGLAASALPAAAGTLLVPQKFPTIQQALNAAKPGDTVLVSPKPNGGVYNEAVTISTRRVTLQGKNNPVIDGTGLGNAVDPNGIAVDPNGIEVAANHVAVCGMTVQGFGFGLNGVTTASAVNVGATDQLTGNGVSYSDITISGNTLQKNYNGLTIQGYTGSDPYSSANTYLKGYQVTGNILTGNSNDGALISGASVLVSGNGATGNGGYGLDVTGIGVTVSGNESGGNGGGLSITDAAYTYDPSVNDPKNPNPAPTVTTLNYVHDNGGDGIDATGTQTISGNVVANSVGYGVYLNAADFSTVTGNAVTGTALMTFIHDDGTGIYADNSSYYGSPSGLKISLNQISGNAGDGIYFYNYAGGVISLNNVTGNQGIGIHLSDYSADRGADDLAPTTVTQNLALHNTVLDARDDAAAPDDIRVNGELFYGDVGTLYNIWTKDLFGTTDPVGLGK